MTPRPDAHRRSQRCLDRLTGRLAAQQVAARVLTVAAHLAADAAVLMLLAMPLAFLSTDAANIRTRLELATKNGPVHLGLPRANLAGGLADISTVVVEPNATNQFLHRLFCQAIISTCDASLSALKACFNALGQRGRLRRRTIGVRLQHFLCVRHNGYLRNR